MDFHSILFQLGPLAGLGILLIGVGAMARPASASAGFGISTSGTGLAYVRATGARDIFIGLTFFLLRWKGTPELMGWLSICSAFVAGFDFIITRSGGARALSFVHLSGFVLAVAYGLALLA